MKKVIVFLFIVFSLKSFGFKLSTTEDSIKFKRNEIGLNILPIVNLFSGATPYHNVRFSINYRYFLSANNVMRYSLAVFPFNNYFVQSTNGFFTLDQVSDTNLIYKNIQHSKSPRWQLNLGYERIIINKKLIHSFGAESFLYYQHLNMKENYYWTGNSTPLNSNVTHLINISNNDVDTMGVNKVTDVIGLGIHLLYNIRIPIGKRWIISNTVGPNLAVSFNNIRVSTRKTGVRETYKSTSVDFEGALFTDLSICYRF